MTQQQREAIQRATELLTDSLTAGHVSVRREQAQNIIEAIVEAATPGPTEHAEAVKALIREGVEGGAWRVAPELKQRASVRVQFMGRDIDHLTLEELRAALRMLSQDHEWTSGLRHPERLQVDVRLAPGTSDPRD